MRWLALTLAVVVAAVDLSVLILFLRPFTRTAWTSGGAIARVGVTLVGLVQLLVLAGAALFIWLALIPAGGGCCL